MGGVGHIVCQFNLVALYKPHPGRRRYPPAILLGCRKNIFWRCRGNNNTVKNSLPIVQHFVEILLIVIQLC
jgi:hypothetical protein